MPFRPSCSVRPTWHAVICLPFKHQSFPCKRRDRAGRIEHGARPSFSAVTLTASSSVSVDNEVHLSEAGMIDISTSQAVTKHDNTRTGNVRENCQHSLGGGNHYYYHHVGQHLFFCSQKAAWLHKPTKNHLIASVTGGEKALDRKPGKHGCWSRLSPNWPVTGQLAELSGFNSSGTVTGIGLQITTAISGAKRLSVQAPDHLLPPSPRPRAPLEQAAPQALLF